VNPTQFNDPKDFQKYPKTLETDLQLAARADVDVVFLPQHHEIYPDDYNFSVREKTLSSRFCGAYRPGHFEGMLTVVLRLLNLVRPHFAFFGEKDFQQLQLIKGLVKAFFLPVHIIAVPTVRDSSGLALSSRNQRLSPVGLEKAKLLNGILKSKSSLEHKKSELTHQGFEVEYVEAFEDRILAAVWLEQVRLIDNVQA
jgi:pantoate--beta-alanine ligase